MAEREKRVIVPLTNVMHCEDDSGLRIEVDLAGATKESVELEMGNGGFCVKAEGEGVIYESCFMLAHEVKPRQAKARFESGLLTIEVPFKEDVRGYKVPVQ
jgi:HSP20 family molecular chaperone IbpA